MLLCLVVQALSSVCMLLQVTALSELVIEVWGLPSQSMFSSRHGSSSSSSRAGPHGKAGSSSAGSGKQDGTGMSSRAGDGAASSNGYGSQPNSLPSGSIFLGAVNVSSGALLTYYCVGCV
jgi:hypothetical protein